MFHGQTLHILHLHALVIDGGLLYDVYIELCLGSHQLHWYFRKHKKCRFYRPYQGGSIQLSKKKIFNMSRTRVSVY